MTTLLIQTPDLPLMVNFPAIVQMTHEQFYEFYQANRDLRIERTATGEVIIMPPAFSDTGNRNLNIAAQLWNWTEQDGTGIGFHSSAGFTLPNGAISAGQLANSLECRVVRHKLGEICIPLKAQRIVALDVPTILDPLLALGVKPVGRAGDYLGKIRYFTALFPEKVAGIEVVGVEENPLWKKFCRSNQI